MNHKTIKKNNRSEWYRSNRRKIKARMKESVRKEKNIRKQEHKKKRKKLKGLDKYVIFCFTSLIVYTILQTIVTIKTGVESSTLTTCFFSVFGGEVLLCALIKKMKLHNESTEKESEVENDELDS